MTKNVALQEKLVVLTNALLHAHPLYLMYGSQIARKACDIIEGVHYILRAIAYHVYGSAHYIFFRQHSISFWRSHSPYSQLYCK